MDSNTFAISSASAVGSSVRRLHRHEAHHLQQVSHQHVSESTGVLIEAGPRTDAHLLWHVDQHMVDVRPIPDRLEHPVGKPQSQDVLDRLLSEEVIDPVHL